jgi:hypothetical protein
MAGIAVRPLIATAIIDSGRGDARELNTTSVPLQSRGGPPGVFVSGPSGIGKLIARHQRLELGAKQPWRFDPIAHPIFVGSPATLYHRNGAGVSAIFVER